MNGLFKIRYAAFLFVITALGITLWFFRFSNQQPAATAATLHTSPVQMPAQEPNLQPANIESTITQTTKPTDALPNKGNPSKSEELSIRDMEKHLAGLPTDNEFMIGNDFLDTRGHTDFEKMKAYEGYSQDTLNALADNGDLLASNVLIKRAWEDPSMNPELVLAEAERAILHGSTYAFSSKALALKAQLYRFEKGSIEYRAHVKEILMNCEVGIMRGDMTLKGDIKRFFNEQASELSAEEKKEIPKMAQDYYQSLVKKRQELGLGEFDEEIPENLEYYFDMYNN